MLNSTILTAFTAGHSATTGIGYSTDLQTFTSSTCFKQTLSIDKDNPISSPEALWTGSMSFSNLLSALNIDAE